MGTTPWDGKRAAVNNPDHAVNHVTWDDAMAFCAKLKAKLCRLCGTRKKAKFQRTYQWHRLLSTCQR